ncbi:MAG: alpha/beta hydrolase [Blastocatellia bacterium]
MSQETQQNDMTKKRVVIELPGMDDVMIRRDLEYQRSEAGALTFDLYTPPGVQSDARLPAVVFVTGYSDPGFQRMLGCRLKEMGSYVSWGQLTAASGLVAITYSAVDPANDVNALLDYLRQHAAELGIDEQQIGVWACSGNVPNALAVLMQQRDELRCAVLCYGLMLDTAGSANVAEAARMFGFANPGAGRTVSDLPANLPLLIVRAGQDNPQLNETIDSFIKDALACNLPVTFINHPTAPHAFDVLDDSATSREIIRQMLNFMRFHLLSV